MIQYISLRPWEKLMYQIRIIAKRQLIQCYCNLISAQVYNIIGIRTLFQNKNKQKKERKKKEIDLSVTKN